MWAAGTELDRVKHHDPIISDDQVDIAVLIFASLV